MEKIIDKFNQYEMFAYFVPGCIFAFIAYTALSVLYPELINSISVDNKLVEILMFLLSGYFFGVLIHEVGEILQNLINKILGGLPSKRFLDEKSGIFSSKKEIEQYKKLATEKFGIDAQTPDDADLVFHRCRASLADTDCYASIEVINHNYGMCRSFMAIAAICMTIVFITYLLHKTLLNAIIFDACLLVTIIYARRVDRFGKTYVKKILRAAYKKAY